MWLVHRVCGCQTRVHPDGITLEMYFCPLHEAAPELLEALEKICTEVENWHALHFSELIPVMRAAIRKAKGQ